MGNLLFVGHNHFVVHEAEGRLYVTVEVLFGFALYVAPFMMFFTMRSPSE